MSPKAERTYGTSFYMVYINDYFRINWYTFSSKENKIVVATANFLFHLVTVRSHHISFYKEREL